VYFYDYLTILGISIPSGAIKSKRDDNYMLSHIAQFQFLLVRLRAAAAEEVEEMIFKAVFQFLLVRLRDTKDVLLGDVITKEFQFLLVRLRVQIFVVN